MNPDVSFCNTIARSSPNSVTEKKDRLRTVSTRVKNGTPRASPHSHTQFVRYFETPSPGRAVGRVLDFDAFALRQKCPVVDRIPVFERRRVLVRGLRQVQFHRLRFVQVVVDEIYPYALADCKR